MTRFISRIEKHGLTARSASGHSPVAVPAFGLYVAACLALMSGPLLETASLTWRLDQYSHIAVVPAVSIYFLYRFRYRIFAAPRFAFVQGAAWMIAGLAARLIAVLWAGQLGASNSLALSMLALVLLLIGGFIGFFGAAAWRAARFPLYFLLLAVPVPDEVLRVVVTGLQAGSAAVLGSLYSLFDIPYLREGFVFHLPKASIEIAEECSGIRSSTALLILSVIAGELYLRRGYNRVLLTTSVLPLVLVKNGIRIFVLSMLGCYVDKSFLTGRLHRDGGFVFFLLALALWMPLLRLLQGLENQRDRSTPPALAEPSQDVFVGQ